MRIMRNDLSEIHSEKLGHIIAELLGLHFSRARRDDLRRGFESASQEFGFANVVSCMEWLLSTTPSVVQRQILASHLTIGETHFFREQRTLDALAETILPALINARRDHRQQLRIWSAACCSGEEAYSLAILLHRALPDLKKWQVTITATDINPRFLKKAATGIYSKWSFRGAPAWLQKNYFNVTPDSNYVVIPEIKKMVSFGTLNLANEAFPSAIDVSKMDIIFCRNVLMYFTAALIPKVIGNLHRTLNAGGWLAVSPSEATRALFPQFRTVHFPGAILFQKHALPSMPDTTSTAGGRSSTSPRSNMTSQPFLPSSRAFADVHAFATPMESDIRASKSATLANINLLQDEIPYAESPDGLIRSVAQNVVGLAEVSDRARALANQGSLAEALVWCDRWIAIDKLSSAGYYLRGVVLQEQGNLDDARMALQRAVYLDQEFVLAHFALGSVAHRCGRYAEARRHFANTRHLLRRYLPDDPLPESKDVSAGQLTEIFSCLKELEAVP